MTHPEAVKGRLAEGYLLGDLSMEQLEEYEEHYFGCPICAEEVKLGAVFLANIKRVLGSEQHTPEI